MKIILKSLLVLIFFIYSLLIFLPKENLYYFGLEKLLDYKVEIVTNDVKDTYIGIDLKDTKIKYENIDVLHIDKILVRTFLFQTSITLSDIKIDPSLNKFLPVNMKSIKIVHNILNPFVIDIIPSKNFNIRDKNIMKYLTKTENGYRYEYKY